MIKGLQLLLSLSILVILHELGHFIPAKIFKTRVEKFYLFFDVKFSLLKKKIGDTEYGIGWLPLGGYVKISGMIDESMDTDQMKKPPKPWEFRSKPAWQRLIIMLGGVTVNLLLGFLIYMMILFVWGKDNLHSESLPNGLSPSRLAKEIGFEEKDNIITVDGEKLDNVLNINRNLFLRNVDQVTVKRINGSIETLSIPEDMGQKMFESGEMLPLTPSIELIVDEVVKNSPAENSGLLKGDKIIAVNEDKISDFNKFTTLLRTKKFDSLNLTISRLDRFDVSEEIILKVFPNENGTIGFYRQTVDFKHQELSLLESITEGFSYGYWTLHDYIAQFKYVFTKKGATQMGGFGAIGSLFPSQWDWKGFWSSTALISIILAFMNILPIPALDGGHVMFLFYEIITGRKPNDKFMEVAQIIGFILLISLVLFANGNDVYRWLFN